MTCPPVRKSVNAQLNIPADVSATNNTITIEWDMLQEGFWFSDRGEHTLKDDG